MVVLEQRTAPITESRASTLHARTMEILDQRGLLGPLGIPASETKGHFGGIPLDFGCLDSRYPGLWKVLQARTEALLWRWAADLGADLRRGYELSALTEHPGHVEVEVLGPDGSVSLRAPYIVGCDGEDSTVGRLAGFDFPGADASRELLRADVAGIDIPNRRFQRFAAGLAVAARRDDGVTRVMVHEFAGRPALRTGAPAFAEIAGAWARVTGEDISVGTPLWSNAFGNTCRQADRYRGNRVLLAGDAAHRQMPVGGQALNLGLQDAMNLGWKLAAHVSGRAPAELLDTYHHERHPVGARTLANIAAQAAILLGGPEVDALRAVFEELIAVDEVAGHLTGMISGLDTHYSHGPGSDPLLGARLPLYDLKTERGLLNAAVPLRTGSGLLLHLTEGGPPEPWPSATAAPWADRVRTVTAAPVPDGVLSGTESVLVRPDGHIAWAGGDADGLRAALGRWFGAPAGS
ncbi:FAD-dependent monooxygenase [Streptomyces sp. RKAG290]|uniref:FAD-dependent monooxygenase n=1 Tax=Streptomyces sp. RKAG290 TaxID=2888348 RepID=UPI0020337AB0|nr:FAD-dependent monooxygenase [Streptomyces sp. RKAG290]MCM2414271.1 FAD-dependent monooxygenase [Streptomyces sp. RKAG290]